VTNRITGLIYWKPVWVAYQQEIGTCPKILHRIFWAENYDAVHLVYLKWSVGEEVDDPCVEGPTSV